MTCYILPPHILKKLSENAGYRDIALKTLETSERMRGLRQATTLLPVFGLAGAEVRAIFNAQNQINLPGAMVPNGSPLAASDLAAEEAYKYSGDTYDFYSKVFNRNSIDDHGLPLKSTVHYDVNYDNAFWNGQQMIYGDGDGRLFQRFTICVDVVGHELTHGVTQNEAQLLYSGQSGALNESISDVFGSLVKQWVNNQSVKDADWLIGGGLFTSAVHGLALRSMSAPGTAYDDPVLGADPQPAHMNKYDPTTDDNGGVHINSGIPNRAFYLAATNIGGFAWQKAGLIWYRTLSGRLSPTANFQAMADATVSVAGSLFGQKSLEQEAVADAWATVGIKPSAAPAIALTAPSKNLVPSNQYTYRDPLLSVWQSAAAEVSATRARIASASQGILTQSVPDFSAPIHSVAAAANSGLKSLPAAEGVLGVVGDCAAAASKFLWAEITGDHEKAQLYSDELKKAECDAAGWSSCLATYLAYKAGGGDLPYRNNTNIVRPINNKVRIAIIGDWGTGEHAAIALLNEVKKQSPELLIHLGDIYYSGTQTEAKSNFLDICRTVLGANYPLYTLCGNHDMYSGGNGYYWLIDQIGQNSSYFALKNDHWQLLAMDTGHNDNSPITVATNMTSLNGNEPQWHQGQIPDPQGRKTILLSHHQLFSAFGAVGTVGGKKYAYNPNIYDTFKAVMGQIEWWFWGHEHTLAIYQPYMGLKRGRCVGCSAVPVFKDQQSYVSAAGLVTLDPSMPVWQPTAQLGNNGSLYNFAFAILALDAEAASVEYFQAPVDGVCQSIYKE